MTSESTADVATSDGVTSDEAAAGEATSDLTTSGLLTEDPPAVDVDAATAAVDGARGGRTTSTRPKRRRSLKSVKKATVVTHRWTSLLLGLLLVLITTTGAAAVYAPEWVHWSNGSVFHVTKSEHPVTATDALGIVDTAYPDFDAASVNVYDGLYEVMSADDDAHPGFYGVDPGTGRITGHANPDSGVMAVMVQIHECFFTCEGYPAHLSFLNHPMPTLGMHWLKDVSVAGFLLAISGLLLVFLALSGIWLWWPSLRRFGNGFRVRLRKGRYARDYDLHQVIGIVAVPFLLVWGLTGASFEFHWVNTAFYAVTGGQQPADDDTFTSADAPARTPDITPAQALTAAQAVAGPKATVANLFLPDADDATGTYTFYFSRGFDAWRYGAYPGQYEVDVDRHNASRTHVDDLGAAPTVSNMVLDYWGGPTLHYGQSVNGWWRLFWFVLGLTPLVLAITGVSTWLAKRKVRKRRRTVARVAVPVGPAATAAQTPAASETPDIPETPDSAEPAVSPKP
jgi:uncharacterized iron-regulated membrane protein